MRTWAEMSRPVRIHPVTGAVIAVLENPLMRYAGKGGQQGRGKWAHGPRAAARTVRPYGGRQPACGGTHGPVFDERACGQCGERFTPKHGNQKYCRKECQIAAAGSRLPRQLCEVCGIEFQPKRARQKCCGKRCGWRYQYGPRAGAARGTA